ncbi:MAG: hypothetical protein A2Z16_11180 [Chloroflexi bacterium RBG_16_54_18]|nr:MAG: hypothetical protein A2Z16_11180 [Chloroflexi bacterium RBG_16_54_18]
MKPAFLHWVVSLVVLISLIPFQSGRVHAAALDASSTAGGVLASINSPLSLQGWFHILWGDPADAVGEGEIFYLLVDDQGRSYYLDLGSAGKPFSELLLLNGERVSLQGTWSDILRDSKRSPVLVEDIRSQENIPLSGEDQSQPLPPVLGNQKYVSILCKFSDFAVEPRNLAFFQGMYANAFPGLDHYWRELSYNQLDLLGSTAVGWFNLPQPRSYYIYDMDSDSDPDADFARLTADCTAAADASVYFPDFEGVSLMFNADLDGYSYGGGYPISLDSPTPQNYGVTWIADWGYADISVVEHEMGHSFGLPHSSGMYGETYDNYWDVMSMDRQWGLPDSTYGRTGQHTIAYHKDLLGWLSAADKFTVPQDGVVHTITVERLANPQTANPRLAILPVIGSSRFYTLETRQWLDGGYDKNIFGFQVVIHEVDPARENQAQVVDYDNNYDTRDDGARWQTWPGLMETFIDATDGISVTVSSVGETNHTVRVKITSPFPFSTCASQNQMPPASCEALLAFYASTGGGSWANHLGWGGPEWPCRWYGVKCKDEFGDVTDLDYYQNGLSGTLPPQLGNLLQLRSLVIQYEGLTGSIPPQLGNLTNLNALVLQHNQLTGNIPAELGSMTALAQLGLGWNQLSGSLPASLGNLSNLYSLDLNYNQLSGSLPPSLGNLSNLLALQVSGNQFSGSLPPEFSSFTKLTSFSVGHNQFSGSIPAFLGNNPSLFSLQLDNNNFSGELPAELGNLDNLWEIDVSYNQLSGSIPSALGDMANLHYAYLYHNQLSGPIPESLVAIPTLDGLRLNENALEGPIPANLGDNPAISYLNLANNKLAGEIPANLADLPELYQLDLGYNSLSATEPGLLAFLSVEDSDWAQTQTVAPTNLQTAQQGADIRLTWTPILYTGDGGNYEISAASSPGGPFAVIGSTANKSVSEFVAGELGSGSYFFRLRTLTPQHGNQQSDLWSSYTNSVPYQAWATFLPVAIR